MPKPITDDLAYAFEVEKKRLADYPYFERSENTPDGVLLSDEIARYSEECYRLIDPFELKSLRPAGYDLRVGAHYAIDGEIHTLGPGQSLVIPPYSVAIIQTRETLNLPAFLIGRWNIRVKLAYEGLLWVGGAQVDPGFRGRLACPIYNLSEVAVKLAYEQSLAMIDFVTTTPYREGEGGSIPFQWWNNKRLLFQQYDLHLKSGVAKTLRDFEGKLATEAEAVALTMDEAAQKAGSDIRSINSRIDTFLTLVFTVVSVLFAGLGVVATKGSNDPGFLSSPVFISSIALFLAFRAYVDVDQGVVDEIISSPPGFWRRVGRRIRNHPYELAACLAIVVGSALVQHHYKEKNLSVDSKLIEVQTKNAQLAEQVRNLSASQERLTLSLHVQELEMSKRSRLTATK